MVGVSSALAIQEALPGVEVTIIAAELTPDTTGDGSAGVWGPRSIDGAPEQVGTGFVPLVKVVSSVLNSKRYIIDGSFIGG